MDSAWQRARKCAAATFGILDRQAAGLGLAVEVGAQALDALLGPAS